MLDGVRRAFAMRTPLSLPTTRPAFMDQEVTNLEELLEQIAAAARECEQVSLEMVVDAVGNRAFGPLLLLVGVILFSPLSGIPGLPTLMSLLTLLVALQLLLHRRHFWLPRWLLRRSLPRDKLLAALAWLDSPARFIDRWLRPRLTFLVRAAGSHLIALVCILIAAATPLLEVVPFSATTAGFALALFGLALVAQDGLLALFAVLFTALAFALVAYSLYWAT